jgi:hypothetical protein
MEKREKWARVLRIVFIVLISAAALYIAISLKNDDLFVKGILSLAVLYFLSVRFFSFEDHSPVNNGFPRDIRDVLFIYIFLSTAVYQLVLVIVRLIHLLWL